MSISNFILKKSLFIILVIISFACKNTVNLPTSDFVDLNKYAGLWYEIARLPNNFEKDLECVSAQYTVLENGEIEVQNKGLSSKRNKISKIKGKAWIPNNKFPGRLKVQFF